MNPSKLSPRQLQVWKLVAQNETTKTMADILNLNIKTIDYHKDRLCRSLGFRGDAALARFAIRVGLIKV